MIYWEAEKTGPKDVLLSRSILRIFRQSRGERGAERGSKSDLFINHVISHLIVIQLISSFSGSAVVVVVELNGMASGGGKQEEEEE